MKFKNLIGALATVGSLAAAPASADLALMLSAGAPLPFPGTTASSITIFDNAAGPGITDASADPGTVVFIGALGAWNINVTTGLGSETLGGPELDLTSVNVSTIGAPPPSGLPGAPTAGTGTSLEIQLSENNLSLGAATQLFDFFGGIGGTSDGRISWAMYIDDGNTLFGLSQLIGMGQFTGAGDTPFAAGLDTLRAVTDTFSMTLRVVIEHGDGVANTSFNFSGSTSSFTDAALRVPEPGTLLLLGAGLVVWALLRRPRHS